MRTQLILESWQYDRLKSIAEERETSLSSLVSGKRSLGTCRCEEEKLVSRT